MAEVLLRKMEDFLTNSGFTFTREWLEACMDWIQENYSPSELTETNCRDLVVQQWADVNLEEMKSCCLPSRLAAQSRVVLPGMYGLQINAILDIGESAYNQYNKIKKLENENTNVSAKDSNELKPTWQPKQRSCLYLTLTDGTQTVQGLEVVSIPSLQPSKGICAGSKVVISGPIECRRGVFMLKPENVKVWKGTVEELSSKNSIENILSQILKGAPHPGVISTGNSNSGTDSQEVNPIRTAQTQPVPDDFEDDDLMMEIDEEAILRSHPSHSQHPVPVTQPIPAVQRTVSPQVSTLPTSRTNKKTFVPPVKRPTPTPPEPTSSREGTGSSFESVFKSAKVVDTDGKQQTKISAFMKPVQPQLKPSRQTLNQRIPEPEIIDLDLDDSFDMEFLEAASSFPQSSSTSRVDSERAVSPDTTVEESSQEGQLIKIVSKAPWGFIRQVKQKEFKIGTIVPVKGTITTLVSNLQVDKPSGTWKLRVILNDGTGAVLARISPEIITELTGFSPGEMKIMKATGGLPGKATVMEGIRKLTSTLIHLNCIFELKVGSTEEVTVVGLTDVTEKHIEMLERRLGLFVDQDQE